MVSVKLRYLEKKQDLPTRELGATFEERMSLVTVRDCQDVRRSRCVEL